MSDAISSILIYGPTGSYSLARYVVFRNYVIHSDNTGTKRFSIAPDWNSKRAFEYIPGRSCEMNR